MTTLNSEYKSPRNWSAIISLIQSARRFVFSTHADPDGDGLGSELALARWLKRRGKSVSILNPTGMNGIYTFLDPHGEIESFDPAQHTELVQNADAFIVFDIGDFTRLFGVGKAMLATGKPLISIDHHPGDKHQFSHSLDDATASASGILVYDLIKSLGAREIDYDLALPLYTAIVNDTGNFRFNNTNAETHLVAIDLLKAGVNPNEVYTHIYEQISRGKAEILKFLLENLNFSDNGELAWTVLRQTNLDAAHATMDDIQGLSDFMRSIKGVEIACSIVALDGEPVKISLRSKGKYTVNDVARQFGGGGHNFAAGGQMDLPLVEVTERVVKACMEKVGVPVHAK